MSATREDLLRSEPRAIRSSSPHGHPPPRRRSRPRSATGQRFILLTHDRTAPGSSACVRGDGSATRRCPTPSRSGRTGGTVPAECDYPDGPPSPRRRALLGQCIRRHPQGRDDHEGCHMVVPFLVSHLARLAMVVRRCCSTKSSEDANASPSPAQPTCLQPRRLRPRALAA